MQILSNSGEPINFPVGMPVIAMIIGIDSKKLRLTASLLRHRTSPPKSKDSPSVGQAVTGFVAEVNAERATFVLQPSQRHASMNLDSFPSSQRLGAGTKLSSALARGEEIRDLIVVSHSAEHVIIASVSNSNRRPDNIAFDEMAEGAEVAGRVVASGPKSAVVRLSKTSSGVLHITDCADDYSQFDGLPPIQSVVKAVIIGRDPIQHILQLSTRPSRMLAHQALAPSVVRDPEITTFDQLSMGQNVRGFIQNIANHGLFVIIGRGLVARVQIRELFDEVSGIILGLMHPFMVVQYIQDWQSKFHTGDLVSGRIKRSDSLRFYRDVRELRQLISVDTSRGLVELTLRSFDTARAICSGQAMVGLVVGQIVDGRVKRKEKYGIFIELPDFSISGLCHKTEVHGSLQHIPIYLYASDIRLTGLRFVNGCLS
jgi:rRNA biogenesis protein RRP5